MQDLTLLQKKVLKLLTMNCRYTLSEIATAANTTPATVQYTIQQLFEKKKVGYPVTIFNGRPFGYRVYYLFLKVIDPDVSFKVLRKHKAIVAIIRTFGIWDVQIIVHAKDSSEIEQMVSEISVVISGIANYEVYEHLQEMKWNYLLSEYDVDVKVPLAKKNITKNLTSSNIAVPYEFGSDTLDDIDRKIIKKLLENPMLSYVSLAQAADSNHETVRYRIKRMIEKKWLQGFSVTPNFSAFGYFSYIVLMKTTSVLQKEFKAYIEQEHDVWYATQTFGAHNIALYIGAKSPEEFTKKISNFRKILGISLIDIQFLLFENEEYNNQFPHELLE